MDKEQKKEILHTIKTDESFKKELMTAIVSEKSFVDAIAREVFAHSALAIGLNAPGTIAEFFRSDRFKET